MRGTIRSLGILSVSLGLLGAACGSPVASTVASAAATHTYYIAADEVTWDYAPMNRNVTSGKPFGVEEAQWVARGPHKIGKELEAEGSNWPPLKAGLFGGVLDQAKEAKTKFDGFLSQIHWF